MQTLLPDHWIEELGDYFVRENLHSRGIKFEQFIAQPKRFGFVSTRTEEEHFNELLENCF